MVQRLLAVGKQGGTHPKLVQHAADLLAGYTRVVHHQHLQLRAVGGHCHRRVEYCFTAYLGDIGQHAFNVDHLDQLALKAGHRRQIARFGAQFRWRVDVFHRDVDDALHVADQEALDRAVELGHDQVAGRGVRIGLTLGVADGQAQVQHRHRAATDVGHAGELAGQSGHLEQLRAAQDFLHLEDIDAKKLTSAEAEQQQRQAIVAGQSGPLVDPVEQVMGHGCCIGGVGAELERFCRVEPCSTLPL